MSRAQADCVIQNELGLHLRAAAAFVKLAERFSSDVSVHRGDISVNGKSIIALVTLAAPKGTRIGVIVEGEDAEEAIEALVALIDDRFGEEA